MSNKVHKVLVLAGEGIHSEKETALAFQAVGFATEIRYLNALVRDRLTLDTLSLDYKVIAIPGGSTYGDDLGCGKILALKIQRLLGWDFQKFAERGGLVLGIGNGFQILIRLGIFGRDLSMAVNMDGKFHDTWVRVIPAYSRCIWLRGIGSMDLPIRHRAGRIVFASDRKKEFLGKLEKHGMTCLKYETNLNGSDERLAGLCDSTGRILGMMPHPEGFIRWTAHPEWTMQNSRAGSPGQGLLIFENAFREATQS